MTELDFSFFKDQQLPLLIQPKVAHQANINYLVQFLNDQNQLFKAKLLNYGAILLRGFHVNSADHFSEVIHACSLGAIYNYDQCIVPRTKIKQGMYTSTNAHESIGLPMHNEKAYSNDFPHHLYLNCLKPAIKGGNTPLIDGHQLWLSLPFALQKKLEKKGILYSSFYYGPGLESKLMRLVAKDLIGPSWMQVFQTENKIHVETTLKQRKTNYHWTSKGNGLVLKTWRPAHRHHPLNDKTVWFNHSSFNNNYFRGSLDPSNLTQNRILRFILSQQRFISYLASFGDGEPISKSEANLLNETIINKKIALRLNQGDVMVIDNLLCMHGKEPHKGERLILTSMTK